MCFFVIVLIAVPNLKLKTSLRQLAELRLQIPCVCQVKPGVVDIRTYWTYLTQVCRKGPSASAHLCGSSFYRNAFSSAPRWTTKIQKVKFIQRPSELVFLGTFWNLKAAWLISFFLSFLSSILDWCGSAVIYALDIVDGRGNALITLVHRWGSTWNPEVIAFMKSTWKIQVHMKGRVWSYGDLLRSLMDVHRK